MNKHDKHLGIFCSSLWVKDSSIRRISLLSSARPVSIILCFLTHSPPFSFSETHFSGIFFLSDNNTRALDQLSAVSVTSYCAWLISYAMNSPPLSRMHERTNWGDSIHAILQAYRGHCCFPSLLLLVFYFRKQAWHSCCLQNPSPCLLLRKRTRKLTWIGRLCLARKTAQKTTKPNRNLCVHSRT